MDAAVAGRPIQRPACLSEKVARFTLSFRRAGNRHELRPIATDRNELRWRPALGPEGDGPPTARPGGWNSDTGMAS